LKDATKFGGKKRGILFVKKGAEKKGDLKRSGERGGEQGNPSPKEGSFGGIFRKHQLSGESSQG